ADQPADAAQLGIYSPDLGLPPTRALSNRWPAVQCPTGTRGSDATDVGDVSRVQGDREGRGRNDGGDRLRGCSFRAEQQVGRDAADDQRAVEANRGEPGQ